MALKCTYLTLYNYGLLSILVLIGVAIGTWNEIITPTLPNLKQKLNVSYDTMGKIMFTRTTGSIVALILAGYFYDSFPVYVSYMMFCLCLIGGICIIIVPWFNEMWVVIILFFIQYGAQTSLNNGGQLTILKTFKEKALGKLQIYHLGYGIGGILSGFISQPFLHSKGSQKAKFTKYCRRKLGDLNVTIDNIQNFTNNSTKPDLKTKDQFEYIYLIAGLMAFVISFIFLAYVFVKKPRRSIVKPKRKESWILKIHPKYIANGKICYGTCMTVLLFLYYFFYMFGLLTFTPYLVVFAIDPCKDYVMNQNTAAYMHSTSNACFLLGRIINSFILDHNPTIIILITYVLNLIFILVLIIFSNKYMIALWIGICGMRFCNSIVYPTGTGYVNRYIIVTSSLISIAFLGATVGGSTGQLFGGYIIDNYPSYYILYFCFVLMLIFLITTIVIIILGYKNGLRDMNEKQDEPDSTNIKLVK